jgi:predicted nucleic acid-binding protein
MTQQEVASVRSSFEEDRRSGFWHYRPLSEEVFEICTGLGLKYAATFGNRTLDTLHVAAALGLKAEHFWTFDRRQNEVVIAAGLKPLRG